MHKNPELPEKIANSDTSDYIGFSDALNIIYSQIRPTGILELSLDLCYGHIAAEDIKALMDNPPDDVSLMDGFAIKSDDVKQASSEYPANLQVSGSASAGNPFKGRVPQGNAIKIFSGALIPDGSNAIAPVEYCQEISTYVLVKSSFEAGNNILSKGMEIKAGSTIIEKGSTLLPGCIGLAVASGINRVRIYRRPRVAVLAIGDELVMPGKQLLPGQIYASNLFTICAWLTSLGISYDTGVIADNKDAIRVELAKYLTNADAIITSGGAWGSERDLIVDILDEMGWTKLFHHIRMRPGKGTSFGIMQGKPVFCLPGGPAGNQKAFLQLALPGIVRLGGQAKHPLQRICARISHAIESRYGNWTEFKDASLSCDIEGHYRVTPCYNLSSLQSIASADCLICIPEGKESLDAGELIPVQLIKNAPDFIAGTIV
jgi:molybdopterin molybdotransferase